MVHLLTLKKALQLRKLKKSKLNLKKLELQLLLNKSHIIIRLRNSYLPVFESDKRLIETDKLIWFPAKNPAKNSLAGFCFNKFSGVDIRVSTPFCVLEVIMQKEEQSSRQMVMCHLVAILGVDIEKATQLIDEMEQVGLVRFDEFGNVGILVLEGQS